MLCAFIEHPNRKQAQWQPQPTKAASTLPSKGTKVVDKDPVFEGLSATSLQVEHLKQILSSEQEVTTRSSLLSTVRLSHDHYHKFCRFGTQV